MNTLLKMNALVFSWLAITLAAPVFAEEIYHWVDDQGVNHYSQSPPAAGPEKARTLQVDGSQPASYDPTEDRYNVAAQAEATQAVWDELAESRKAKQAADPQPSSQVIYYPQANDSYGNNILYPPGYRPPNNRPPRPPGKPDRPETLPEDLAPPMNSKPFRPIKR